MRGVEETQFPQTMDSGHCSRVESSALKQKSGSTLSKTRSGGDGGKPFPGGPVVKPHTSSAGSMGSIPSQVDHNP